MTLALGIGAASPAASQRLRGQLLDLYSEEPVRSGLLTLLSEDSVAMATAISDAEGYWMLEIPVPGAYYVEARRLGFGTFFHEGYSVLVWKPYSRRPQLLKGTAPAPR